MSHCCSALHHLCQSCLLSQMNMSIQIAAESLVFSGIICYFSAAVAALKKSFSLCFVFPQLWHDPIKIWKPTWDIARKDQNKHNRPFHQLSLCIKSMFLSWQICAVLLLLIHFHIAVSLRRYLTQAFIGHFMALYMAQQIWHYMAPAVAWHHMAQGTILHKLLTSCLDHVWKVLTLAII